MVVPTAEISDAICRAFARAKRYDEPYLYFYADDLLPQALAEALALLPIEAPDPSRFSGQRDAQNEARFFINAAAVRRCRSGRFFGSSPIPLLKRNLPA